MTYGLIRKQRAVTGMSLYTTSSTTFSVKLDGGLDLKRLHEQHEDGLFSFVPSSRPVFFFVSFFMRPTSAV